MVRSEDKLKAILPYMLKRAWKVKFGRKKESSMHELGSFSIIKTVERVGTENKLTMVSTVTLELGEVPGWYRKNLPLGPGRSRRRNDERGQARH